MCSVAQSCCLVAQSCPTPHDPMDFSPPGSSVHGDSPGKNTRVGCHALFQGIFPTQGSNLSLLCLLHWPAGSLPLAPPCCPASPVKDPLEKNKCHLGLTQSGWKALWRPQWPCVVVATVREKGSRAEGERTEPSGGRQPGQTELFLLRLELHSRPSTDLYSRRVHPFSLSSEGSRVLCELGRKQALTRQNQKQV